VKKEKKDINQIAKMIVDKATKEKPVQKKPKQSGIKKSVKGG
jgi:hypothetical protein